MSETPNPYQPPVETSEGTIVAPTVWASHPEGRIAFELALTERDVKRFFPSPLPARVFVLLGAILFLLFLWAMARALLVMLAVVAVLLLLIRTRLNWRMAIRQSPRLLKPASGYISEQGIYTSSDGCQGYSRWEDLHAIRTTKDCVLFSGENWRLVSMIIPWTSFSDPASAQQGLNRVLTQRESWRPMALGDPRLLEPPVDDPLFQPQGPHVAFDGQVTFAEIAASVPGQKLRRMVRRWMPVIAMLLIVAALSVLGGLAVALLLGVPLLVFSIAIMVQLWRHPLVRGGKSRVAFRSRGWFCESGFFLQSVTGQSLRQWHSVDHQWHDDSLLCICLPGVSEGWFFFSRGQFASDEDYQHACKWTEAGLGEAR